MLFLSVFGLHWVALLTSECSVHICCHNQPALSESKHSSLAKWGFKCLKTNVATHQLYYFWWCSSLAWQTTPGSHCRGKNLVALLLVIISELQKFLRLFISVQIFVTRLSRYTQRLCSAHSSSATSLWLFFVDVLLISMVSNSILRPPLALKRKSYNFGSDLCDKT